MLTSKHCYALLAALMIATVPQALGVEKLELVPSEFCVTNPDHEVTIAIWLEDIDPANPITGANMNLEWDSNSCWVVSLEDIVPGDGFEQFGTEDCGPGYIRYSVHVSGAEGIVDSQPIAFVTFTAIMPVDECCVDTFTLTAGSGASATKVVGEYPYVSIPDLGDPQEVRVDVIDPVITCEPDVYMPTDPGVCYWDPGTNGIIDPLVTDNCEPECLVLSYERSDGKSKLDLFDLGETFIYWSVLDCCTNGDECTQLVSVSDEEPPVIVPDSGEYTYAADGTCHWELIDFRTNGDIGMVITDNCDPDPNVTQMPLPGTILELGTYDVTVNANDSHGNNAVGNYVVHVTDQMAPVFTLAPDDIEVYADAGLCTANVTWNISAIDECGPVCLECDPPSGTDFEIGTSGVMCTATDGAGNVTSHGFNVIVMPYWVLNVEVGLKGYVSSGPFDRCVQFEYGCDGPVPAHEVMGQLTFEGGVAIGQLLLEVPDPCEEREYACARARDIRHSLWEMAEGPSNVYMAGTEFFAKFLGDDALRLGNLNQDEYIDIVDWSIWQGQFLGLAPVPDLPEDLCDPFPTELIADVSGDGRVTAVDYGHLYINNFEEDDSPCCMRSKGRSSGHGPRGRVSVAELEAMGISYAAQLDRNGNGFVDLMDAGMRRTKSVRFSPSPFRVHR